MSAFSKQAAEAKAKAIAEAKRMALRPAILRTPEVKAAWNSIPMPLRKKANLDLSSFSNTAMISVAMYDLDSFKDKKLTRVLEKFLDWDTHTNDYTYELPNKDIRFTKAFNDPKIGKFEVSVTVFAYVKADSPLCRIVTTGFTEEVVRKEIKQIVCA